MPRPLLALAVSFAILLGATPLGAQSTFGSIVGTVKDSSEAAVPAVVITVLELDKNTTQTVVSNDEGLYELLDLKPGRYAITATKAGFSTFAVPEVVLPGRETVRADIRLQPAPVKESVVVTGVAAIINTENGTISDTKSFRQITELPLNYRGVTTSPLAALMTVPGVQGDLVNQPSVGGGLPAQVEYSLDGISTANVREFGPLFEMYASTEMLSEFKVISVNNNAEYGQMGDVTVITRGGANPLHGSALWYHQNAALDATIYGAPEKQAKVYNTFGGSFSGPVYLPKLYRGRDRTFFFLDYEGNRKPSTVLEQLSVPTPSMRAGDLQGVPGGPAVDPLSGAPFPGNIIPATRINSVAHTLLTKFYPLPNYNAGTTNADYRPLVPNTIDTDGYDVRIDHVLSSRQQIFARWTWKKISSLGSNELLPPSHNDDRYRNLIFSDNFILRPNLINESRFGFSLFLHRERFPILGADADAALGLQGLNLSHVHGTGGFPLFDFSDGTGFYAIGKPRDGPASSRNWQFTDNLSWIRGRHSMRFGADVRHIGWESVLSFGGGDDFGSFGFQQGAFSGNAFADLLLGLPYVSEYGLIGPNLNEVANHFHFYGQDEWRVNDRLTVNFGLRWTLHPPMTEASGNITNFDTATGNIIVPDHTLPAAPGFLVGVNACPGTITTIPCTKIITASQAGLGPGLRRTYYGNWAPRVSFAWRPFANNKTVVRSGFGEFTQTILGQTAYGPTGIHTTDLRDSFNYQGPGHCSTFRSAPGCKWPFFVAAAWQLNFSATAWTLTMKIRDRISGISRSNTRLLPERLCGSVTSACIQSASMSWWATSRSTPVQSRILRATVRTQQSAASKCGRTLASPAMRPYKRRLSAGFPEACFSRPAMPIRKTLATLAAFGAARGTFCFRRRPCQIRSQTASTPGLTAAISPDQGQIVSCSPEFTSCRGGRDGALAAHLNPFANALLGGWDLSTITLLESGPFQTALIGGRFDQSNSTIGGGRNGRPDRIGDGNLPNPTPDRWYDITAFEPTPKGAGRFGNSGVGILRGPGIATVAAGLFKSFSITEKLKMRIEGTFTNIANHPNFYPPPTQVDSPVSFGKITQVQSELRQPRRPGRRALDLVAMTHSLFRQSQKMAGNDTERASLAGSSIGIANAIFSAGMLAS